MFEWYRDAKAQRKLKLLIGFKSDDSAAFPAPNGADETIQHLWICRQLPGPRRSTWTGVQGAPLQAEQQAVLAADVITVWNFTRGRSSNRLISNSWTLCTFDTKEQHCQSLHQTVGNTSSWSNTRMAPGQSGNEGHTGDHTEHHST